MLKTRRSFFTGLGMALAIPTMVSAQAKEFTRFALSKAIFNLAGRALKAGHIKEHKALMLIFTNMIKEGVE